MFLLPSPDVYVYNTGMIMIMVKPKQQQTRHIKKKTAEKALNTTFLEGRTANIGTTHLLLCILRIFMRQMLCKVHSF